MRVVKPTEEEQIAIRKIVVDLAEYYSVTLSDNQIDMYVRDLLEMGSELAMKAVLEYTQSWNSVKFPLPSQLRKQIFFGISC